MTTFEQACKERGYDFTYNDDDALTNIHIGWDLARHFFTEPKVDEKPAEEILYFYTGEMMDELGDVIGYVEGLIGRPKPIKYEEYHELRERLLKESTLPDATDIRLTSLSKVS
jgi:hypothetical protein